MSPHESTVRERLKVVYKEIYEMTNPECRRCRLPFSCCSPEHCEDAREFAKEHWGVELKPTDHPKLPFMGPQGCTVEPHLRPLCTVHTCEIGSIGVKRGDSRWTERYFNLRDESSDLEFELKPIDPT